MAGEDARRLGVSPARRLERAVDRHALDAVAHAVDRVQVVDAGRAMLIDQRHADVCGPAFTRRRNLRGPRP